MAQVKVTLVKSPIGRKPNHRATVKGLGLRKVNHSRILKDSPEVRGMINTIGYMLKVEEVA
jgi:large subunit ribosomal protein L30